MHEVLDVIRNQTSNKRWLRKKVLPQADAVFMALSNPVVVVVDIQLQELSTSIEHDTTSFEGVNRRLEAQAFRENIKLQALLAKVEM
jgi:hypothetical protein